MGWARQSARAKEFLAAPAGICVAWLCWATLVVTIGVLIIVGSDHTVLPAYRDAAVAWFAGGDIYNATGHGFLYLPSAAILFAPFAALPVPVSEIAWRVLTIGMFAWSVRRLATFAGRGLSFDLFALMTLAALPPALSCARNGQSTLIMTATMILGLVDLGEGRRWRAAGWLSLSLALKPLALVLILLLAALDRRMAGRLLVGVAAVLLFPFATQTAPYVADQYVKSVQMFRASSHCGMVELWAQPFSVLSLAGIVVPESVQTLVRAAAGPVTLLLCAAAKRRRDFRDFVPYLLAFSVLYILLFNPRTENNTYAMLGPAIGLFAAPWIAKDVHRAAVWYLSLILLLLSAGDELVRVATPPGEHIWLKPSLALLFLLFLIHRLFGATRAAAEPASGRSALEARPRPVLAAAGRRVAGAAGDGQGSFNS